MRRGWASLLRSVLRAGLGVLAAQLAKASKSSHQEQEGRRSIGEGSSDQGALAKQSGRVRHVVDGDSLYIEGVEPQIRLWGVDAPERDEAGYSEARTYLRTLALGEVITIEEQDRDKYGRIVARCFLADGREINRLLIESGLVDEYMRFTDGFYSD